MFWVDNLLQYKYVKEYGLNEKRCSAEYTESVQCEVTYT